MRLYPRRISAVVALLAFGLGACGLTPINVDRYTYPCATDADCAGLVCVQGLCQKKVDEAPPAGLTYQPSALRCVVNQPCGAAVPSLASGVASSFSVEPGLPAGLTLGRTGEISGTAKGAAPTAAYTLTARNPSGSASATVTVTVEEPAPSFSYVPASLTCSVGSPCPALSPTVTVGVVSSWSVAPPLPGGLALDPATGVLSGTPLLVAAAASYVVTGTNPTGSAAATLSLTINDRSPGAVVYTPSSIVCARTVGCGPFAPTTGDGGVPTSWSVAPSLPAGLTLNQGTGLITGTPTAVTPMSASTVTASNSGGSNSGTVAFTVNDLPVASLVYSPLTCTKGAPCSTATPSTTGGAPVSFTVSPPLPAGLTLDPSTGAVSGTPTVVAAAATYAVTVSNTGGAFTSNVSLTVNDQAIATLSYAVSPLVCTNAIPCVDTPATTGGTPTSFTVAPPLPTGLTLNALTGVISGTTTTVSSATAYTITAQNSAGLRNVFLSVSSVATPIGALVYTPSTLVCTTGQACGPATAAVTGGGTASGFSVSSSGPALPAGLTLNASTGTINGTPTTVSAAAIVSVSATVASTPVTALISVSVRDLAVQTVTFSPASLTCTRGSPCGTTTPSTSGGTPTGFSVSPALPPGLALSTTTGVITGTPSVVSAATPYTVTATNSGGSATTTISIAVNELAVATLSYTPDPLTCIKGTPCGPATPMTTGGAPTGFSVTPALPAGLVLNPSTGVIAGTPTALAASATYQVTASNAGGGKTGTLAVLVGDPAIATLTYAPASLTCTVGQACSAIASTTGGAPTGFSISPALPSGLSINPSTGGISGVPVLAAAATSYTVTASNGVGAKTATITITTGEAPILTLTYAPNPLTCSNGTACGPATPSTSGGAPTGFTISPALPAGLAMSATTGVISGAPTTPSVSASYTITATNGAGSKTATITVVVTDVAPGALTYSPSSLTCTKGSACGPANPSLGGGGAVIGWSVSPALPTGLTLSATTGVISGTPTVVTATKTVTVTATNSGGTSTAAVNVTVNDLPPGTLSYTPPTLGCATGTVCSATPVLGAGGAVKTWAVSPPLPAGLTINSILGIISGMPAAAFPLTTYTITAGNTGGTSTGTIAISAALAPFTTWTTVTAPFPGIWWLGAAYNGNTIVAFDGSTPVIKYSTNLGVTWTPLTLSGAIRSIAYGGGHFVASNGIGFQSSTDGVTWSVSKPFPAGTPLASTFGFAGDRFFAIAPGRTTAGASYSFDGVTWVAGSLTAGDTWNGSAIAYVNGLYLIKDYQNAGGFYSLDGVNWKSWSRSAFDWAGGNAAAVSGTTVFLSDTTVMPGLTEQILTAGSPFAARGGTGWGSSAQPTLVGGYLVVAENNAGRISWLNPTGGWVDQATGIAAGSGLAAFAAGDKLFILQPSSGTMAWASSNAATASLSSQVLRFGTTVTGTPVPLPLTISNPGPVALTVGTPIVSGPFSVTANGCAGPVAAAGGTCSITVTFSPTSGGPAEGTLLLPTNAPDGAISVRLFGAGRANGTSSALVTPSTLALSATATLTSLPGTVTVTNYGTATLTVASATTAPPFAVVSNGCSTVAAGASCAILVRVTPPAVGTSTGTLVVTDNSGGVAGSTQQVTLQGKGNLPGLNWQTIPAQSGPWPPNGGVAFGAGRFVAVTNTGNYVATLPTAWTWVAKSSFSTFGTRAPVAFGNNQFMTVGSIGGAGSCQKSGDGLAWMACADLPAPPATLFYTSLVSDDLGTWVALACGYAYCTGTNGVVSVDDGASWQPWTTASVDYTGPLAFGAGKFMSVGWNSTVVKSGDGVTWQKTTMGCAGNSMWGPLAYGLGKFIAASGVARTVSCTSPDGVTWTPGVLPAIRFRALNFSNGVFWGLGGFYSSASNDTAVSGDGVNWTVGTLPASSAMWLWGAGGNGAFVAGSTDASWAWSD